MLFVGWTNSTIWLARGYGKGRSIVLSTSPRTEAVVHIPTARLIVAKPAETGSPLKLLQTSRIRTCRYDNIAILQSLCEESNLAGASLAASLPLSIAALHQANSFYASAPARAECIRLTSQGVPIPDETVRREMRSWSG